MPSYLQNQLFQAQLKNINEFYLSVSFLLPFLPDYRFYNVLIFIHLKQFQHYQIIHVEHLYDY